MVQEETQGATGEPAQPEAAGSAFDDDAILAPLEKPAAPAPAPAGLDKDLLEKLRGIDPAQLPPDLRAKLEQPFLSQFTKRQQEVSEREKAITDLLLKRLSPAQQSQPDIRQRLLDEVKAGNLDQIGDLLDATVQQRVGPLQDQLAQTQAMQAAVQLHPYVGTRQAEIGEVIKANPHLAPLIMADGYRNAPVILQGIAQSIELQELKAKLGNFEAEKVEYGKKVLEAATRRAKGVPTRTSEAGSAHSGGAPAGGFSDLRAAMRAAAQQHGMQVPD